jgi:DinB family protein
MNEACLMVRESLRGRLRGQLDAAYLLLGNARPDAIGWRPASGKWSARENLAHPGRYHEVFLQRVRRILSEDRPMRGRYRAEDDPEWPRWASLSMDGFLRRIRTLRPELTSLVEGLCDPDLDKIGNHPLLGDANIRRWLEFFLLHEAHHLYTIMIRLGGAAAACNGEPDV